MKFKIIVLLLFANISLAVQVCKTESEIPSTTPDSRFRDNANGTISDDGTGLMWQKCQLGQTGSICSNGSPNTYTWQQALEEAENNSIAGFSDWRLPNQKELLSIVEQRCINPSINMNYFLNTGDYTFWSSSPYSESTSDAWHVDFSNGNPNYDSRSLVARVRLVRTGQ